MSFNRLLVPMDFSENSINSLKCALEIAKIFDSKITVLNAYNLSESYVQGAYIAYISSLEQDITDRIKMDFDSIIEKLEATDYVDKKEVRYSSPVEAILETAEDEQADLIVMGRSGTNRLMDKTLGTVAYLVIRDAKCPVLAVPEKINHIDFSKILLAVDFAGPWKKPVNKTLHTILEKVNGQVTVVNVEKNSADIADETIKERKKILEDGLSGIEHSFECVSGENVESGLNQFVESHQMKLLAMVPHEHSFLDMIFQPSVTRQMTLHLGVPLLALK